MSYPLKHTSNAIFTIFHVKVIPVKPLDVEKDIKSYMEEVKKEEPLDVEKAKKLYLGKVEKEDDHEHKGKLPINI